MDRAEMINSLAAAMGVKVPGKETELSKKYNVSTGTIYCNRAVENDTAEDNLINSVSLFPAKRMAM